MDGKSVNGDIVRTTAPANKTSLVQTIKSFEKCMLDMRSTVLVPTRLNDIESETMTANGFSNIRSDNSNLFDVYNDLRRTVRILYGEKNSLDPNFSTNKMQTDINGNKDQCLLQNGVDKCLSADENLVSKLEYHVKHLKVILDEMCGTAEYITNVYKEDVQNMHMNYNHIEYNNNDVKHYYTSNGTLARTE